MVDFEKLAGDTSELLAKINSRRKIVTETFYRGLGDEVLGASEDNIGIGINNQKIKNTDYFENGGVESGAHGVIVKKSGLYLLEHYFIGSCLAGSSWNFGVYNKARYENPTLTVEEVKGSVFTLSKMVSGNIVTNTRSSVVYIEEGTELFIKIFGELSIKTSYPTTTNVKLTYLGEKI